MSSVACLTRASRTAFSRSIRSVTSQHVPRTTPALSALARYYASKSYPSHTVISMPALSPTMTAGNIGSWQKKPGDTLSPGDVLVEIETDKAQMDFEFQEEGVLAKILKDSGEKDVAVGNPIAVYVEDASDVEAFADFDLSDAGGDKQKPASDNSKGQEAADASEPPQEGSKTAPPPPKDEKQEASSAPEAQESESTGERLQLSIDRDSISPAVKRLALEKGVPLSALKAKATKQDVENYKPASPAPASAAAAPKASYEDIPASSMRKTIGSRLQTSKNESPDFVVGSNISVSKLLKLREALNAESNGKYKLSINDMFIKAVALAATKVPAVNASWREEGKEVFIRQFSGVDVSVAVATPVGLMTPIVAGAQALGLEAISSQVKDLGKRARDGKLKPEQYQGGSITISNMGMNSAVSFFSAIINPPQSAIVAVGSIQKVAVPKDPEDEDAGVHFDSQITVVTSFNHKVVDGAVGGEFMRELKKIVENPLSLML